MMPVIHLRDFEPVAERSGEQTWMCVQRAWDEKPEQRVEVAASLQRIVRAVKDVVSRR